MDFSWSASSQPFPKAAPKRIPFSHDVTLLPFCAVEGGQADDRRQRQDESSRLGNRLDASRSGCRAAANRSRPDRPAAMSVAPPSCGRVFIGGPHRGDSRLRVRGGAELVSSPAPFRCRGRQQGPPASTQPARPTFKMPVLGSRRGAGEVERAARDRRAAGVGVGAGEREQSRAGHDQRERAAAAIGDRAAVVRGNRRPAADRHGRRAGWSCSGRSICRPSSRTATGRCSFWALRSNDALATRCSARRCPVRRNSWSKASRP